VILQKFLTIKILLLALIAVLLISCTNSKVSTLDFNWLNANKIEAGIEQPKFNDTKYFIKDFGAVSDGIFDCTNAINSAIQKCSANGGGKVVITKGIYLTGSIHLLSNVNLHIEENAVLKFSTDPEKYLPIVFTRWEGVECMNYSSLIYAYGQQNIAITGKGILDGQSSNEN